MNSTETNRKISEKLGDFEVMENLVPSEEWIQGLMKRLDGAGPYRPRTPRVSKFTAAVLFIVLINAGIILAAVLSNPEQTLRRNDALQIISREMLVNPDLLKE